MQRRTANTAGTARSLFDNTSSGTAPMTPSAAGRHKKGREDSRGPSIAVLLIIAGALILINFMIPNGVEQEEKIMYNKLIEAEEQLMDQWKKSAHIPQQVRKDPIYDKRLKEEATKRMKENMPANSWVEGEKKLKQKLKVLAERQKEGKDLGVPVLTRYLGEDIPAWPDGTMDEDTWRKKVDERYKQMREEEEEWRKRVGEFMATYNTHG